jgi:hypothetical protein
MRVQTEAHFGSQKTMGPIGKKTAKDLPIIIFGAFGRHGLLHQGFMLL